MNHDNDNDNMMIIMMMMIDDKPETIDQGRSLTERQQRRSRGQRTIHRLIQMK